MTEIYSSEKYEEALGRIDAVENVSIEWDNEKGEWVRVSRAPEAVSRKLEPANLGKPSCGA